MLLSKHSVFTFYFHASWAKIYEQTNIFYQSILNALFRYLHDIDGLLTHSPKAIGFGHFRQENAQKYPVNPVNSVYYIVFLDRIQSFRS